MELELAEKETCSLKWWHVCVGWCAGYVTVDGRRMVVWVGEELSQTAQANHLSIVNQLTISII